MILLDVNLILAAHRDDHVDHPAARVWLDALLADGGQFGVPWIVWWSFLRIGSHPRIFPVPTPVAQGLHFIAAIRAQPGHVGVEPGLRHPELLRDACRRGEATANLLPDAVLVALATEHGAAVASFDRDFARFDGLDWVRPS
ncbi:MAG: type II toxin-antitoxin system VapC family toxin [Actinomycetota bacterium]|nr:type II toxin-antitoxin system VapC family toxin [Actinomycetota bacterium]